MSAAAGLGIVRAVATFTTWLALGIAAGITAALVVPAALGLQALTVMSGSMEPAISTGDIIVDAKIPAAEAKVGDVITFRDPAAPERLKTHRVYGMEIENGTVRFATKGDANNTAEKWEVAATGEIGRVVYRLWRLGYVTHWITSRSGRLAMLALPALLLGIFELKRIWMPRSEPA